MTPLDQALADLTTAISLWPAAHDHAWSPLHATTTSHVGGNRQRRITPPHRVDPHAYRHYRAAIAQLPVLAAAIRKLGVPIATRFDPDNAAPSATAIDRLIQLRATLRIHTPALKDADLEPVDDITHRLVNHLHKAIGTPGHRHPCPNPNQYRGCAGVRTPRAQTCIPCREHNKYLRTRGQPVK